MGWDQVHPLGFANASGFPYCSPPAPFSSLQTWPNIWSFVWKTLLDRRPKPHDLACGFYRCCSWKPQFLTKALPTFGKTAVFADCGWSLAQKPWFLAKKLEFLWIVGGAKLSKTVPFKNCTFQKLHLSKPCLSKTALFKNHTFQKLHFSRTAPFKNCAFQKPCLSKTAVFTKICDFRMAKRKTTCLER